MLEYEIDLYDKDYKLIGGIDEAGRGPLAGPVVAACVILPSNYFNDEINDSKKLTEKRREMLYSIIMENAISVGIGIVDEKIIDKINILEATKLAMIKAINNSKIKPEHILIDAVKLNTDIPSTSIIKGDAKSQTIAAASIVAKVTRDHLLIKLDKKYPEYDFKGNKGYGTKKHIDAIKKYGITPLHRKTFAKVKEHIK